MDEAKIALIPQEEIAAPPPQSEQLTGSVLESLSWLRSVAMAAHIAALLFCGYIIFIAGPGSSESPPRLTILYLLLLLSLLRRNWLWW